MPEQIILEFVGDPTGLKPLADAMGALGQLTDDQAASLRKATEDYNKRKAAIVAGEKATQDAINKSAQSLSNEAKQMESLSKGLGNIQKSIAGGNIKQGVDDFKKLGTNIQEAATKSISLKGQLLALKKELQGLDEGDKKFKKLSIEAAKLEDKIGDVNQQIRTLASDTFAFDAVVDGVRGMTAAFSFAQGASALLGSENEDLQKTLVKLNALMLVSTSLQELANQLTGQGAAKLAVISAAQKVYTFAVGSTTGALRLFRLALLATGIGAIIFLLYEGAKAFGIFGDAVDADTEGLNKNTDALADNAEERERALVDQAKLLVGQSMGAKGIDVLRNAVLELDKANLEALKTELESLLVGQQRQAANEKDAKFRAVFNAEVKKYEERLALVNAQLDLYNVKTAKATEETKKLADELPTEMLEQMAEGVRQQLEREERARQEKLAAEQALGDAIVSNEQEVLNKIAELHAKADAKELADTQKLEAEKKAVKDAAQQALQQSIQLFFDTIFTIANANRNAEYEAELANAAAIRDGLLQNEDLTQAQIAAINEQYRQQESEIKRQQFEKNKQAAIAQAIINTALAVINAITTGDPYTAAIRAALAGAIGAAQIAVIAAQPTPAFAEGTEYVERGRNPKGRDTIHAMLDEGERVVPTAINKKLGGIPNSELPRLVAMANMMPQISGDLLAQMERGNPFEIDYKLMAKELGATLENATKPNINIDKTGLNILLVKGNRRQHYLNNRYLN